VIHVHHLRLYAVAILFATWAVAWALGLRGDALAVVFLAATAVCVIVSERERQVSVRDRKGGYRR
jgi:uncharacterized membrane protein